MSFAAEAQRSLAGAWRLAQGKADGMERFDLSVEGFWRSFAAILLVLPSYLMIAATERRLADTADTGEAPGAGLFPVDGLVALGLDWIALPLLLFALARPLGIARTYASYVVARNWMSVVAGVPYALVGILLLAGVADAVVGMLSLVVLAALLRYHYVVVRIALGTGRAFSFGLVLLDLVLSLVIGEGVDRLFAVAAQ